MVFASTLFFLSLFHSLLLSLSIKSFPSFEIYLQGHIPHEDFPEDTF